MIKELDKTGGTRDETRQEKHWARRHRTTHKIVETRYTLLQSKCNAKKLLSNSESTFAIKVE